MVMVNMQPAMSNRNNTLNIYSQKNEYRLITKSKIVICCFAIGLLFYTSHHDGERTQRAASQEGKHDDTHNIQMHKCWLKRALTLGKFHIFSHRSYFDNTQSMQPTCQEALEQLKSIGVNHLDLDLVLADKDPTTDDPHMHKIVVAHPMEFKHESDFYSPCGNTDFDEMISTLSKVYDGNFFISMEPKAAWKRTEKELHDLALVNTPSTILEILLLKIVQHNLGGNCAAIVPDIHDREVVVQDEHELQKERSLLDNISKQCQLFRGIRLADDAPTTLGRFDMIMPTIEFHPSHPHNIEGKAIPKHLLNKSIFWVVDNEVDLLLAAELQPFAVVSNNPKHLYDIMHGSNWCSSDDNI